MTSFDFMSDEELRASLESDYAELRASMKGGAWKAVHVLAGSIIETVLVDYLLATSDPKRKTRDPLQMRLVELIAEGRSRGILSEKTEQLSTMVREYRNLIHPGKLVRLKEQVDESNAQVAQALVDIIVKEVTAKRKETYGYTAEQIVYKIEHDSSALAILSHLLKEMRSVEFERLLIKIIPTNYFSYLAELSSTDDNEPREPTSYEMSVARTISSLEQCFRIAFDTATDDVKAKVAKNFVKIVREEIENNVLAYETACFRCVDLKYLSDEETDLVKQHIL